MASTDSVTAIPPAATTKAYPATKVVDSEFGQALVAAEPITAGRKVFAFQGELMAEPNMHTVQLDEGKHIFCQGGPEFTSHSCNPNSYFVFTGTLVELVTMRDVAVGEQLSFDYNTTEWDMSVKFKCLCKHAKCYQVVQGYKHLTAARRAAIEPQISPYIRKRVKQERESEVVEETSPLAAVAVMTPHAPLAAVSAARLAAALAPSSPPSATGEEEKTPPFKDNFRTAVVEAQYGLALVALEDIPVGSTVYRYHGTIQSTPNMHTVQMRADKHILCRGGPCFTCHSCVPNGSFVFDDVNDAIELLAIRPIKSGDQITFDYNTTEWDMSVKFKCMCGQPSCYRMVAGYSHLTRAQRDAIDAHLSPYIRSRASEAVGTSVVFPTAVAETAAPVAAVTA